MPAAMFVRVTAGLRVRQALRGPDAKKGRKPKPPPFYDQNRRDYYTQPVGLGRPAILQAPLPGPEGNSS
jgi:hypothetical protein